MYKHYIEGKLAATYDRPKQSLKEQIEAAKRARRDARLVQIITK